MAGMTLNAEQRTEIGSSAARRIRRSGKVPGIVYGGSGGNIPVSVDPKEILRVLKSGSGRNTIVSLQVEGASADSVILKDWQVDPVREDILHADFQRIAMDEILKVTIPISIRGEAYGVKTDGGLLDVVVRELEVECLPADIPERVECDVSDLKMNESIRVRDLPSLERVTILEDPDRVIAHVVSIKEEEEAAAVEEIEGLEETEGEPDVIAKGKKEEDEEGD